MAGLLLAIHVLLCLTPLSFSWKPMSNGWWDCGDLDKNQCLNQGCIPIPSTTVDQQHRRCVLYPLLTTLERATQPLRLAFVGSSASGKSTCLNSLLAFTLHQKPLPEGGGKERQTTQYWRIEPHAGAKVTLFDTPGFRFDNEANAVIRDAMIQGVAHGQDMEQPVGAWARDPDNAADRFVHVVNVQHAVEEGWLLNTVDKEVVADWAAAFHLLDTRANHSPVLLVNTFGYNPLTVQKVRQQLDTFFGRIQTNALFVLDCKRASEEEFAKMFHQIFMQDAL